MAATAHGKAWVTPPCADRPAGAAAPAGLPQRWQNRAPRVSGARHAAQAAPSSGAPQLEQNFPEAAEPQAGHADESALGELGVVIGAKSSADDQHDSRGLVRVTSARF